MSRKKGRRGGSVAMLVFIIAIFMAARGGGHLSSSFRPAPGAVRARAIAWAERQEGCRYLYGGTGPCSTGFDCSGLIMRAYAHAGEKIPRTSEDQWKLMHHVSSPQPGDLVFFAGSSIDPPPGHVGLVISGHEMIEAYATGYPVRVSSFGTASSPAGDENPAGFAAP